MARISSPATATRSSAMNLSLFALSLLTLLPVSSRIGQDTDPVMKAYHEAFEKQDEAALEELWIEHPGRVLSTIDSDLEGSLSIWEKSPEKPDADAIADLHARAMWGARIASIASSRSIFHDYAASFVGWNNDQKRSFRAGQRAHSVARKALANKDAKAGLNAARECRGLAIALGDWWGTAMGYAAEGDAEHGLGQHAEGLIASSQARLIYQQLGLAGSEYRCLLSMVAQLQEMKRPLRLRVTLTQAIELAGVVGDDAGAARMSETLEGLPE